MYPDFEEEAWTKGEVLVAESPNYLIPPWSGGAGWDAALSMFAHLLQGKQTGASGKLSRITKTWLLSRRRRLLWVQGAGIPRK
jgi:hypothetical protein